MAASGVRTIAEKTLSQIDHRRGRDPSTCAMRAVNGREDEICSQRSFVFLWRFLK
jgi:hypothetical protein